MRIRIYDEHHEVWVYYSGSQGHIVDTLMNYIKQNCGKEVELL